MKKQYFFILLTTTTIASLAFTKMSKNIEITKRKNSHLKFSAGVPAGKTGAPGEANCTECHGGTVQDGTGLNILTLLDETQEAVIEYTPGESYTVGIDMPPAAKRGFQVSPRIASDDSKAGNSVGIPSISTVTSESGKQYISHNAASNTSQSGWAFSWTAPSTDVGDVIFYLATNQTDNSGTVEVGDIIRTSQHTFAAQSQSASLKEKNPKVSLEVGFSKQNNSLFLNFSSLQSGTAFVNLVDMTGKSVFTSKITNAKIGSNQETILLPGGLKEGVYVVNLFVNNNSVSKRIMISK